MFLSLYSEFCKTVSRLQPNPRTPNLRTLIETSVDPCNTLNQKPTEGGRLGGMALLRAGLRNCAAAGNPAAHKCPVRVYRFGVEGALRGLGSRV